MSAFAVALHQGKIVVIIVIFSPLLTIWDYKLIVGWACSISIRYLQGHGNSNLRNVDNLFPIGGTLAFGRDKHKSGAMH